MCGKNHGPLSRDRGVKAKSFSAESPRTWWFSNLLDLPERAMNSLLRATLDEGSKQTGGEDAVASGSPGIGEDGSRRAGVAEAVDNQVGAGQVVVGRVVVDDDGTTRAGGPGRSHA